MLSFSCRYCTQLWQYLSTPWMHKYALYANIFFLISGHCEWRAALRVNRKAKPPQAVGLFQPMFSQHMHHIKTQDLYFLSDSAFKEPFPKMWPWCRRSTSESEEVFRHPESRIADESSAKEYPRQTWHWAGETGFEGRSHGNGLPAKAKEGVP